jgi:SAM-dependent methyltransferase
MIFQDGIPVGNVEDKSALKNPLARRLVAGFDRALLALLDRARPASLHEVGCGEGRLARLIRQQWDVPFRATDFSTALIEALRLNPVAGVEFHCRSIYELSPDRDGADVVLCCEVLEHLEDPARGLRALRGLNPRLCIFSVPREPLWRALNMARGKYWGDWGNTPGHLNHWSVAGFHQFLEGQGFVVEQTRLPLPWIMVMGQFKPL